jgi:hypothetical protein
MVGYAIGYLCGVEPSGVFFDQPTHTAGDRGGLIYCLYLSDSLLWGEDFMCQIQASRLQADQFK